MRYHRTGLALWLSAILTTIVAARYWDAIFGGRR